jgi:DNA-directed RNA polymerase subunit beta'
MIKDFKALKITLASPAQILSWSHGEVKKAETINYRTQRAEVDGLMCERIFGPTKNFECYCGKYKKVRYKGIICDKCGVEVTSKSVRRERMGHIKLVSPVVHVWYSHGVPNKLSLLLDIMQKKLTAVIYFSRYMVIDVNDEEKKAAVEKINSKLDDEKKSLTDQLDEAIAGINKEKDAEVEETKVKSSEKGDALDMTINKVETKYRQRIAKLREEYLVKTNEIEVDYKSLITLVDKVVVGEIISEDEYYRLLDNELEFFQLSMGAEAIKTLLEKLDLEKLSEELKKDIMSPSLQKRIKAIQRLRIIEGFKNNKIKPDWIVMDVVPVISPELRPIIQLMGGRFASSDLNDLYRRVINRNNRLKRLMELGAPEIILRNEKRMLQEAVDALIDNNHRPSTPVMNTRKMPLKSLSDNLRGKQGRFRQNLLGKRVDYSGRAVIVSGADLSLNECGIPKTMALELFRPFVMKEILEREYAPNIKSAKYFFEKQSKEVWDILEEVIQKRPVLLNRAPTLHKQGIQAFFPVLSSGNAIRINPLVCAGFNADFDGDQMAVHVPLSEEAVEEAKNLMMAKNNLLLDADGAPITGPRYDMVYGCFFLTGIDDELPEVKKVYSAPNEAVSDLHGEVIGLRQQIKVRLNGEIVDTTVGRILFNEIMPEGFAFVNYQVGSDEIKKIVQELIEREGMEASVELLDKIKNTGFKYATLSGFSISMDDCKIIPERDEIIAESDKKVQGLEENYQMGLITRGEKSRLALVIWKETTDRIAQLTWDNLGEKNPIRQVIKAKAMKANIDQVKQIAGMRGLLLDPNNKTIELPVRSNFALGLSEMEYFVGSRSTRKVLADTALRTAESGYLTRKLVDVAQGVIVREEDCGTHEGLDIVKTDERRITFINRIEGRYTAKDLMDGKKVLVKADTLITHDIAQKIDESGVESVTLRSALTCRAKYGICKKCYGYDLSTKREVAIGTAVGVIAAQSLGESTTQLTLNTKHTGGIASVVDVTQGLPRAEELFEARIPKGEAKIADIDGIIHIVEDEEKTKVQIVSTAKKSYEVIALPGGTTAVKDGQKVKAGDLLFTSEDKGLVISPFRGTVKIDGDKINVESDRVQEVEYVLPSDAELLVQEGDEIKAGFLITKGNIDPKILLETIGMVKAQKYIIDNIQETYGAQGIAIDDKHVEVIVSQMGRYVRITNPGDSNFLPGEYKDKFEIESANEELKKNGMREITVRPQLIGVTAASLRTESFLSAASFQEQVRVLSDAAIVGKVDYLRGLKENVIIGRRIPTGDRAIISE